MHVVIVESPAKARTVRGCLGAGHTVIATGGHVRDLPAKDGSVDPANGFAIAYATRRGKAPTLRAIAKALEEADALVLATDPDREGEAIAWQVLSWLEDNAALGATPVRRVVFHEVTRDAVQAAMARPRALDMDLVRAQQARRALDYLVGFHLSPVLWRKVRGGRSAGRVQSVALKLLCAREAEIEDFAPREYWSVEAGVTANGGGSFTARLSALDGAELDRLALGTAKSADAAARRVREGVFRVAKLERDTMRRNPVPPFTTATLQQEASRRLGFGVRKTMQLAQALFEGVELDGETAGLITYMRTDSVALSKGAVAAARKIVPGQIRPRLPAPEAPRVPLARAQRPGGARGDSPDRPCAHPGGGGGPPRRGPGRALRARLAAHRREPDGRREARPGAGGARHRRGPTSCSPPRARGPGSTASSGCTARAAARTTTGPGPSGRSPRWPRASGRS